MNHILILSSLTHLPEWYTPSYAIVSDLRRAAMQRGVLKFEPKLLPSFNFLYGPNATGSCYFYGAREL